MLFNIHELEWDKEILEILDIPIEMLPAPMPSSYIYGESDPTILGGPIKIAGAAGDQKRAEQKNCGRKKLKTFHQNNLLSGALAMPALTGAAAVSGCRSTTTNMATMSSAFGIGQNMPGFVMEMSSMAK